MFPGVSSIERSEQILHDLPGIFFLRANKKDLHKNSSPLLSSFSVRDDYRMNDPARKAVLLARRPL
jgi:hypothetical protein